MRTLALSTSVPGITSPSTAIARAGHYFRYPITSSGTPAFFQVTGLPAGLQLNGSQIETVTDADNSPSPTTTAGNSTVTIVASDGVGFGTPFTLNLQIKAPLLTLGNGFSSVLNAGPSPAALTASLSGNLTVTNPGSAAFGSTRIRIVARPGYLRSANATDPTLPAEVALATLTPTSPVAAFSSISLPFNVLCPAKDPDLFTSIGDEGSPLGWEVYGILEEQIGTTWVTQDLLKIYRNWPSIIGPTGGSVTANPTLSSGELSIAQLTSLTLTSPALTVNENNTLSFSATASFSDSSTMAINPVWTASQFSINTSGLFSAGSVSTDTGVSITGTVNVGGTTLQSSRNITVVNAAPPPSELVNISTRLKVQTGDNVLIGGFVIQGTSPRKVIILSTGPSLTNFGVSGALQDPTLELHDSTGAIIASNDNWQSSQASEISSSGHAPTDSRESAIVATLQPGSYTAIVRGVNNSTGVALVEVDTLDTSTNTQLVNISTRGKVETGDNVMIGGFVVQGTSPRKVIILSTGPSLTNFGVSGALQDPTLELHDSTGAIIASNDNWQSSQASDISSSGHAPSDTRESAIVATLQPGSYTAIVRGVNNSTGVALVEVDVLP